ncbi:MAG: hypothetical protein AABO58_01080 [Acidobacteriota bacterium]
MKTVLSAVLLSLSLTACMTTTGRAAHITSCSDDYALLGSWRSYRMSQLGPGWMAITFEDGCRYHTAAQLLFARVKERGNYHVEDGVVILTRSSGAETRWPYRLEGGKLFLQESPDETHAYERVR